MRKILLTTCLLISLAGCKGGDEKTAANDVAQAISSSANKDVLASLSKEQQAAVRLLVRDTLITDPNILMEAQDAYNAKAQREQNEQAGKAFSSLITNAADLYYGPKDAKVIMVVFFDYKCGFCHAATPWINSLIKAHPDIKIIFKELPILSPESLLASKAAIAAKNQGKYLQIHNAFMTEKGSLDEDRIIQIATSFGLDIGKLKSDMNSASTLKLIEKFKSQAADSGVAGTPGFFINGKFISGFASQELDSIIGAEFGAK